MKSDKPFPDQLGLLLVDDEEFNLKALKRLLHNKGFRVFTATSGQDALAIMHVQDIAIVVSDMKMPQMTGAELLTRVWEGWPDTQRIVLTGHTDMREAIDVVNKSNIIGYITKPWDDESFLSTVHKAAALYWGTVMDGLYEKQLRQEQKEAQRISEAKSQFLATMSHEIRTPLNSIIATNTLMLETALSQDQIELAKLSLNGAHSLLTLINDILDSSKINAGRMVLHETWFNLLELVEETCDLLSGNLAGKPVDIMIVIKPGTPSDVYGDKTRFSQILTNLLSNSIKFTESGCITVNLSQTATLNLGVSDTGLGIPNNELPNIFDEFTQVDNSNAQMAGGTGLGLSISKKLCQLMGGEISVESQEQKGTAFRACFPFKISNKIEFPQFALNRKRILLCSLNSDLYEPLKIQLEYFGCDLTLVSSFDVVLVQGYDSVIYDMESLFFMSSPALGHESKTRHVALIGHECMNQSEKLKSDGFDSVLRKPIRVSSLCKSLIYKMDEQPNEDTLSSEQRRQVYQWLNDDVDEPCEPSVANLDGVSVLLAEDSPSNQAVIKSILKSMLVVVDVASNGNEVCAMAANKPYDIILMDVRMPEKDGLMATREIINVSGFNQKTPIVALTANAYSEDKKSCIDAGMVDFISKPINVSELRKTVFEWCSKKRDLIDELTLRQLERDTSTDALPKILGIFVDETQTRLESILMHSKGEQWPELESDAHTLKSCAGSFGAFPLQALARDIESEARLKNSDKIKTLIEAMKDVCERTILKMKEKISEKQYVQK